MEQFETVFTQHSLRMTKPRHIVFQTLLSADKPLSINELTKRCDTIDRTSIYRSLELFEKLSIVSIIHVGWKKRYELAGPFKPHHHHLQCTSCGRLTDLGSERLELLIEQLGQKHGYTPTSHHVEIQGVCSTCQSSGNHVA